MASQAVRSTASKVPSWRRALGKWAYSISYFNQLGLRHDDTLMETPEVKEALRRLPKKLQDERQFRITRALNLSMKKDILPKDEWTKYEEDNSYLQPYLDVVNKEFRERQEWNKK
jgi:ubiquinol-cytochrome c reductase subunit 7